MPESQHGLPRAPVYGPIHKIHRHALAAAVSRLGATDFADEAEALAAAKLVREQLELGRAHLSNEDRHIHPMLGEAGETAIANLEAAHDEHEQAFQLLERLADSVQLGSDADRLRAGGQLYLAFARFVASDFDHMDYEERVIEPIIHAHYSDADIHQLHMSIIAETSPEEMSMLAELAVRALNRSELEALEPVLSASLTDSLAAAE